MEVTARGICWSKSPNPTISDNHSIDGSGIGSFTTTMLNLSAHTTYYVRAYATNDKGTQYGDQKSFRTKSAVPIGGIDGLFSVSESNQVYFSKGNLQYQASNDIWRFADNQYDYSGDDNSNISSTTDVWIDLFGWGTSGFVHGAVCYQPYSTDQDNAKYFAYGGPAQNLYDKTGTADWGYRAISNGGNTYKKWRSLKNEEWSYLFNARNTKSGIRYAKATVNYISGIILLPDYWTSSYYNLNNINTTNAEYSSNLINAYTWENYLEKHGAIFLPAAGYRFGWALESVGSVGCYWSSSVNSGSWAYNMNFGNTGQNTNGRQNRYVGNSVRLVCNVE